MLLNGAQIVIECLKEAGVDTIFGYPGGAILNLYDELYKQKDVIRHVLTSHEQGAAHAADGYARASGRVGVCMATSGPGATNLVTGIATAYMDSVPIVAITCNVGVPLLGKDSFQEVDIAGITTPVTKHNFIVKDIEKLPDTLRRAFKIAKNGRPGPVLVDIPKDITAAECDYLPANAAAETAYKTQKSHCDYTKAISMMEAAKKPFIFVGGGAVISDASDEISALAKLLDAPVCDSLMGKGAFDGRNARYTGMLGMHGTKTSNFGVSECDLLIALGTRFSDRVTGDTRHFAERAKILQFDIDPAEINKNIRADEAVIGDLKTTLGAVIAKLKGQAHPEWMRKIADMKERFPLAVHSDRLSGPGIMREIYRQTGGDAVIVTEVGQHQMWAAQYYTYKRPRMLISSGGLGTMGYGLGAAIGAQIALPESRVINIAGDGCLRMNLNELVTASRQELPLIEIVINNGVLGMVHQWQNLFYGSRYSHTVFDDDLDFVRVAEAMGVPGIHVSDPDEFSAAFSQALFSKRPALIDCSVWEDDQVWPMVAPGAPISESFDESDL